MKEREREREEQTTRRFHLEIISLFQVEPTEKRLSRGPPLKRGVPPLKGEPFVNTCSTKEIAGILVRSWIGGGQSKEGLTPLGRQLAT